MDKVTVLYDGRQVRVAMYELYETNTDFLHLL